MINLVDETISMIKEYNHKPEDVRWIGSFDGEYSMDADTFFKKFKNIEYDSGYGRQEIAADLVVMFTDGSWLERSEYDGSEGWEYKKTPKRAIAPLPFDYITKTENSVGFWDTVANYNGVDVDPFL